jgi:hypothetical protein
MFKEFFRWGGVKRERERFLLRMHIIGSYLDLKGRAGFICTTALSLDTRCLRTSAHGPSQVDFLRLLGRNAMLFFLLLEC